MYKRTSTAAAFAATLALAALTGADQGLAPVDPHRATCPHTGVIKKPPHRTPAGGPTDGPMGTVETRTAIPNFGDEKRGGEIVTVPPPPETPFGDQGSADAPGLDDQYRRRGPNDGPSGAMAPPTGDNRADITGDGRVDFRDLIALLSDWGPTRANTDLTGDGVVDVRDLVFLLSQLTVDTTERPERRQPWERSFLRPGGPQVVHFGDKPVALPPQDPRTPDAPDHEIAP